MADTATEQQELQTRDDQAVAPASAAGAPAAITGGTRDVMAVVDGAVQAGYSPEMIEKMMALAERYEANNARRAFYQALADFRAEAPRIEKNARVHFTTDKGVTDYQHSTLDHIVEVVSPILARYGLSFRWDLEQMDGGALRVRCIVSHRDGHYEVTPLESGRDTSGNKNNLQALGSAQTYLQRYTLIAALGLATAMPDDDGQAGGVQGGAGGGAATIDEQQHSRLLDLIGEARLSEGRFCRQYMLNDVADLPAEWFDTIVQRLNERIKRLRDADAQGGNSNDS